MRGSRGKGGSDRWGELGCCHMAACEWRGNPTFRFGLGNELGTKLIIPLNFWENYEIIHIIGRGV